MMPKFQPTKLQGGVKHPTVKSLPSAQGCGMCLFKDPEAWVPMMLWGGMQVPNRYLRSVDYSKGSVLYSARYYG